MENPASLEPSDLETLADQLEGSFRVTDEDMMAQISALPWAFTSTPPLHPVHLSPVSTFIQGAKDGPFGYIVSSIAKHWGVIVGDSEKFLYHLVFDDRADAVSDANPDSVTGRVRTVKFSCIDWDPSKELPVSTKRVGDTRFSPTDLLRIGLCQRLRTLISRTKDDRSIRELSPCLLELPNLC